MLHGQHDEDAIQVKACQALEKVQKQLSEEAVRHITRAKVTYKPMEGISNIRSSGCKPKSWELNYPALAFLLNGGYYVDYVSIMGTMGLPVMHHSTWDNLVSWVGTHVEKLADWSCDQVRADIVKRGDKAQWTASFDGFYLTRGHHSNNSSATLHDVESDRIAWFTHRTKRGRGSNWEGTSSGAEGDMLDELLRKVKSEGYTVGQIIMDHDTSANAIVCTHFPDIHITYCSNHSAKSFHYELSKIKSLSCKCKKEGKICKRMTEALLDRIKAALRNLMSCDEVLEDSNPLEAFSKGLLNFHSHYCMDKHDSPWCKFHEATKEDGSPYTTKSPLLCSVQSEAFEKLLKSMADRPQEYITAAGKVTTNAVEGFHGLALKYRGKRIDLLSTHYCCKTNMAVCHKNLGPIWKLICLCEMGVDIPEDALSTILNEQKLWEQSRERRNQSGHYHYRSLHKQKVNKRHAAEKEHMITLRAVGCTTAEYVGSSGTANATSSTAIEERDEVDDEEDQDENNADELEEVSPSVDGPSSDELPLLFFFDCESTGGSIYNDHMIEVGAKVVAVPGSVNITQHQYGSLIHSSRSIAKAVQGKCGITAQMLVTEPPFIHVFEELLTWISSTVQEVEQWQQLKYFPVVVAHNGFVFDFLLLLSELHRRNIPFNRLASLNLHFADTLYDCKKHVKNSNSVIFETWTASEKKRLGIGNLYSKYFVDETYNAHRAMDDVVAMERLFINTPLVSLLSSLTVWNVQKLIQEWNNKVQRNNRIQQLVIGFKQDTTKSMAKRLELLGLTYEYLKVQYDSMSSLDAFIKWLCSVGVKHKAWHEKICTHFKKIFKK